jgi:NADH-quinone oxidoreductase subunit A
MPVTLADYLPVIITFFVIGAVAALLFILGLVLGRQTPSPQKMAPFESGNELSTTPRSRFSVKFYLVAIFFIAFDVEAVFMYPWAALYLQKNMDKALMLGEMVFFLLILGVGLAYVWKKGALEWD